MGRCCGQVGLESEWGKLADRCREPVAALGMELWEELVEPEEETEPRDSLSTPDLPNQSVVDDHNIDHCPYCSWCRHCVEGRGHELAHRSVDWDSRKVSTVAFDYLFVIREGVYTREEFDEAANGDQWLKILGVRDSKSGSMFAHGVPWKGLDDKGFIVRCVADDDPWLGYSRVIWKSDNEPAIVAVLKVTLKAVRVYGIVDQALEEHPPPYDC